MYCYELSYRPGSKDAEHWSAEEAGQFKLRLQVK